MGERRNRFEVWAEGIDEGLQGIGSDPYGGGAYTGLRVPFLATPNAKSRYLFMLCGFELAEGVKATIRSWRQLLTVGIQTTVASKSIVIEKEVESPVFRFPDGNVSYHLTRVPPSTMSNLVVGTPPSTGSRIPVNNCAWRMATSSALLYESVNLRGSGFYVDMLPVYVPPNQGKPYGDPIAHLKVIHDRRSDWRASSAWQPLDLEVEGPGFFALWASVFQTSGLFNISSIATALDVVRAGLSDYQFMAAFPPTGGESPVPGIQYWRVGGALDVFIHEDASNTTCRSGR